MSRFAFAVFVVLFGLTAVSPAQAHDHFWLSVNLGGCCGYARPYYPAYPYPSYVYAPPPPVTYVVPQPAPVVYVEPQALPANQASQTYIDGLGRTCRNFQAVVNGMPVVGTACLQPDGTWRTIGQ